MTQGSDPSPDKDKVIVLLTDGDNTQNRWTTSGSSIDARTAAACTNVKAANIKVYTVRVIDGDANLLRNCATKTNMYYDVSQASQLNSVFTSIAQNLANLRIAK
jgi:Mg-chelatase subunit ChlD